MCPPPSRTFPLLLILAGPTASGKTALALAAAEHLGAEIVSADSQQVYRGLDCGTAKPTPDDRRRVPHHLVDAAELHEQFDAARYVRVADAAIADIRARGKRVLVCGGTGLYIRALLRGLAPLPPANARLRAELDARVRSEGLARLYAELQALDPELARAVQPSDPVRIVRGLEIAVGTGRRQSEILAAHAAQPDRYEAQIFALDVPVRELNERIAARARAMLAGPWQEEVRALLARGVDTACPGFAALGYRDVAAHLRGEISAQDMEAAVIRKTRQYAKRQRTWFRHQPGVIWVRPDEAGARLVRAAEGG